MPAGPNAPLLAAIALVLLLIEIFWRTRVISKGYDFAGAAASFGVFIGNVLIGGAVSAAIIGPVYFWCWSVAPVKLPRLWPNSSLSMSSVGIAPQLTAMNG